MKIAPALRIFADQRLGVRRRRSPDARARAGRPARSRRRASAPDDGAEIAPRRAGDLGARQRLELRVHRLLDLVGERGVVGDQDRLRAGVVLGLRQQIGGDPVGIAGLVGEDQHLGRAGDHVDADLAEHQALGRRHIGVAGPDDLGDRLRSSRCRRRARPPPARRRCDRSRRRRRAWPPPAPGRELAVRRRHHHHQPRAAGDLGRHRVHQHRRRIGRGAARHVEPDRLDRGPARAQLDAERVGEAFVASASGAGDRPRCARARA